MGEGGAFAHPPAATAWTAVQALFAACCSRGAACTEVTIYRRHEALRRQMAYAGVSMPACGLRQAVCASAQDPGEHLTAIYDVMMSKPLWQRRNGSDFAFFQVRAEPALPYPILQPRRGLRGLASLHSRSSGGAGPCPNPRA